MMSGDRLGLKLPDICLMGEEKPQKNLTQETCPDRESNTGPLRERRHTLSSTPQRWAWPFLDLIYPIYLLTTGLSKGSTNPLMRSLPLFHP
ncbi:hypothetical protein C0J52_00258 [Blattella germanica]|nr:hypothetical protein C0J52_00258 [Blattella germanica]